MILHDIDLDLGSEVDARPPSMLAAAVMRAVRREAARPAPRAFPWRRFAVGVAASIVLFTLVALHGAALVARL